MHRPPDNTLPPAPATFFADFPVPETPLTEDEIAQALEFVKHNKLGHVIDYESSQWGRQYFAEHVAPVILAYDWHHVSEVEGTDATVHTLPCDDELIPCVLTDAGYCPYKMPPKFPHGEPIRAPYIKMVRKCDIYVESHTGSPVALFCANSDSHFMLHVITRWGTPRKKETK